MKKHRIYVAGPMESVGGNMNEPLFDFVAEELRNLGCEVMNPWDLTRELVGPLTTLQAMSKQERDENRTGCLVKETAWIILQATAVVMLPNWQVSPGATAERAVALAVRKPVYELPASVSLMQRGSVSVPVDLPVAA